MLIFKKLNNLAKKYYLTVYHSVMKIGRVYCNNINYTSQWEKKNPYLYTAPTNNVVTPTKKKSHKREYFAGLLTLFAAGVALSKFLTRNKVPKEVVEVADKAVGLNKIKGCPRTIAQVKEAILYPMMSVMHGEKRPLRGDFKTGLIIGCKNQDKVEEFVSGFMEHCKELRIHCIELKSPKKTNRLKEVHKALDKAIEYHRATGECVVVNIGDLAAVSNHNVAKTNYSSKLEERLAMMPKGVLWTAYTTASDQLPYFYNNIPTLCVKI